MLGATTLQEFGLALLIGLVSGAYSSIFIASPLLAILKEREPRIPRRPPANRARGSPHGGPARTRAESAAALTPSDVEEPAEPVPVPVPAAAGSSGRVSTNIPPRPRKKGKRR